MVTCHVYVKLNFILTKLLEVSNNITSFQPKAKKKFIDKKKAVTFNLVHRSQRDPLVADDTAPQRVLVPVNADVPPRKEKEPVSTKNLVSSRFSGRIWCCEPATL